MLGCVADIGTLIVSSFCVACFLLFESPRTHGERERNESTQLPVHRRPNSEEVVGYTGERVQHKIGSYHIIYHDSSECNERV